MPVSPQELPIDAQQLRSYLNDWRGMKLPVSPVIYQEILLKDPSMLQHLQAVKGSSCKIRTFVESFLDLSNAPIHSELDVTMLVTQVSHYILLHVVIYVIHQGSVDLENGSY